MFWVSHGGNDHAEETSKPKASYMKNQPLREKNAVVFEAKQSKLTTEQRRTGARGDGTLNTAVLEIKASTGSTLLVGALTDHLRVVLDKRVESGVPQRRPDGGRAPDPDGAHPELEGALQQVVGCHVAERGRHHLFRA